MNPLFVVYAMLHYVLVHSASQLNGDQQSEPAVPQDEQRKHSSQVQHTLLESDGEMEDDAVSRNDHTGDVTEEYKLMLWPNGVIPYVISNEYGYADKYKIELVFQEFCRRSHIRFVPRNPKLHLHYIFIQSGDNCSSVIGQIGGEQNIYLNKDDCMDHGTIIHELMHALGFPHEQSRHDRDKYVKVIWRNMKRNCSPNFQKLILQEIMQWDYPYDYGFMHYPTTACSINGAETMRILRTSRIIPGQRNNFSRLDLKKLNQLYRCGNFGWFCFLWRWLGYCESDRPYMVQYCPQKCDLCDDYRLLYRQEKHCKRIE